MPMITAMVYRNNLGLPYVIPKSEYSYAENLMYMMFANPMHSKFPSKTPEAIYKSVGFSMLVPISWLALFKNESRSSDCCRLHRCNGGLSVCRLSPMYVGEFCDESLDRPPKCGLCSSFAVYIAQFPYACKLRCGRVPLAVGECAILPRVPAHDCGLLSTFALPRRIESVTVEHSLSRDCGSLSMLSSSGSPFFVP